MYIVRCDSCKKKYKITDISKINNVYAKFLCKQCGHTFTINKQLKQINNITPYSINYHSKQNNQSNKHLKLPIIYSSNSQKAHFNKKNISLGKLTLRKKFNIALVCIMFFSVLITFLISNHIFQKGAEKNVINNARFLLTTIESSRDFTGKVVKPSLYKVLPGRFIIEAMSSSFGARNIFERIKKKYPEYYFKHATSNPRNIVNLADNFELNIIDNKFKKNKELQEWQGYRDIDRHRDFIIMKPIIAEERCMKCHSVSENAPREILERYGTKAGFGMVVGDVIGALSISVPATEIFNKAINDTIIVNSIVFFSFTFLIIIINMFFHNIVIKPIKKLNRVVDEISVGKSNICINISGSDEITELAKGFERMQTSINLALSKLS
jgi:HAMP domain-containing protein